VASESKYDTDYNYLGRFIAVDGPVDVQTALCFIVDDCKHAIAYPAKSKGAKEAIRGSELPAHKYALSQEIELIKQTGVHTAMIHLASEQAHCDDDADDWYVEYMGDMINGSPFIVAILNPPVNDVDPLDYISTFAFKKIMDKETFTLEVKEIDKEA
jgi:hypothetical protein